MTEPLDFPNEKSSSDPSLQPLLKSLALELIIYTPLVLIYFFIVIRYADEFLTALYSQNRVYYAIMAILAIVGQGVLLERLTTWLLHRFGLRR
jgi:hypothetical protein